jgi:hypothetical protein
MCSIGRIYIPEKHRQFWNDHYKKILFCYENDESTWKFVNSIKFR